MSKDILVFNKQGGVGIEVPPVEDLLTSDGNFNLNVYDENGNRMHYYFRLDNPHKLDEQDNSIKYKIFEEEVDEVLENYNVINVPSSSVMYVFTNINRDSVFVDVPLSNLKNVSISDETYFTGIYAVKVDNTEGSDIKIYYKDCEYAEVLL